MKQPQDSSRRRAGARMGVAAQIILACILLLSVNYVGFHYYARTDWSVGQKYRLSDQTLRLLQHMTAPATVYVFFSPSAAAPGFEVYTDVVNLLKEYQTAAGSGLTVSEIRELLATSRKYAVPLCEYFDRVGFTRREGDLRRLAATPAAV